jgi:hypothetical protein
MTETKEKAVAPKKNDDAIIKELLANAPPVEEVAVELPSKNKFYKLLNPSNPITLRPMNFEDEKSIASNKNVNQNVLNVLLSRCINNVDVRSILLFDKLFLLLKLREISYGTEYKVTLSCPACRKDNQIVFDLTQLGVNYIEDELTNPTSMKLPILKKSVKVRLPRVNDEHYLNNVDEITANLWRFVEEIEGHTKKTIISEVLKNLPLKDIHTLLDVLQGSRYGVDTKVRFACNYCTHNEITDLPITADFFTVN